MKIRNGFVSNSSSSSFIIGIGKITDMNTFEAYCKKNNIDLDNDDVRIITTSEAIESIGNSSWSNPVRKKGDDIILTVESFDGSEVIVKIDPSKEESFVLVHVCNNEGDCGFQYEDDDGEWCEPDYDIGAEFFDSHDQALLDLDGVENYDVYYGAGRNG